MAKTKDSGPAHRFQATETPDHYRVVTSDGGHIGYVVKVEDGWRAQDHNGESVPGDLVHRTRELAAAAIDDHRRNVGLA